jgi:signal transduction histidine kinase
MVLDRAVSQKEHDESILPPHRQYARREFSVWDVTVVEGIAQFAGLAIEQAHWQAEVAIARTNEAEMRASNALKDEFLSITAHEFRSPLTIILANSQMIGRTMRRIPELPKRDRLQECITSIEEQTHQLTNIVSTFLEVSHLNKGQIVLKQEKIDMDELLKQEVNTHSAVTTMHSICYTLETDAPPYYVSGDRARLQQILGNLIQNAIKYSPHGGTITLSTKKMCSSTGQALLEVRVSDEGIGIPADALPHLFERFYRAPNVDSGKTKGIGLGLYLVAELLRLHGGSIRAESSGEYGEGSCFIVTLPLLESDEVD